MNKHLTEKCVLRESAIMTIMTCFFGDSFDISVAWEIYAEKEDNQRTPRNEIWRNRCGQQVLNRRKKMGTAA